MIKPTTAALLTSRLATEQATRRLPSLAAGLVRDGSLVWTDARGTTDARADGTPPGTDTQYRIGSITKTFVAVAVMRLRDEGLIDLNDPLDRHLPGTSAGGATIAQLLSHASGLQAETDGPWWERTPGGDWNDLMAGRPALRHRPGRRFHYSNVGFGVLGELVARLRDASWFDVARAELLEPLGMRRTTTRPEAPFAAGFAVHPFADVVLPEPEHDAGAMAPAGQLWSTVDDLACWAALLAGHADHVISSDTLAEMREPLVVDDTPGAPWTGAYGLGVQLWNVGGRRFVGHGGSMPGFVAVLRVDAQTGDGIVAFTNSTAGFAGTFASELMTDLAEAEPRTPTPWHVRSEASSSLDVVGPWYWGPMRFELRSDADEVLHLTPTGEGWRASRFRPADDGAWVGLDGYYAGEPLRVVRHEDGSVSHLDLASFRFTRTPYDPRADVPGGVDEGGWR